MNRDQQDPAAGVVHELAAFAADAMAGTPDEVAASVRQRVLDIVGLALAATPLATSRAATDLIAARGGAPQARAIGLADRVPAAGAAFVNGVLAHSLDYDDTHLPSVLHPSASVVPAALAAGEAVGAPGRLVVGAVAAGLEICVRLGMAGYDPEAGNSLFFEHGQHATSICGAVGGAAAAALASGGDAETVADAMGIAASMSSGILEANRTGGTVKRMHCGWAAQAAVTAAELAARGITGPPTVLEGRFGFFQAWLHEGPRLEALTGGLGEDWQVPGIFFKPYPANHFTHAGIDAAMQLRERGLAADDVAGLHLQVARPTVRTIGEPIDVKRAPDTGYQAQFSGPYTVVAGLLGGGGLGVALEDFTDELARDDHRRDLMSRVTVGSSPELDEVFPHQFPAILTATTTTGDELVAQQLVNRGGPDDPLSEDELACKFTDNAATVLSDPARAEQVVDRALDLESLDDVAMLLADLGTLREVRP